MRILTLLAITLACVFVCEGRHRNREDRKLHKKSTRELGVPYSHHGSKHSGHGSIRGKHLDLDHFKSFDFKAIKDDEWMKFPKKSSQCTTIKCPPKHFCLTDPSTKKEKCVSYRNFREGRRLFRSYHKQKELFDKHNHGKLSDALESKITKAESVKDVYELLKDYKPLSNKHQDTKIIDIKSISEAVDPKNIKEADPATLQECRANELFQLKERLVGWFVLLHTESRQHHHHQKHKDHHKKGHHGKPGLIHDPFGMDKPGSDKHYGKVEKVHDKLDLHKRTRRSTTSEIEVEIHGHCKCSKSVMWQFTHMDASADGHLSHEELASIESIQREPCLKPLIKSCDQGGDGRLTRGEWCCCMRDTVPPCAEKKRQSLKSDWVPKCDEEGYYHREQCTKTGYCWCVDLDGNTIADMKVYGSAHCGKYDPNGKLIKM